MLTNDSFKLSDDQLAAYNQWSAEVASHAFNADCGESHEIEIRFSFSPYGRTVVAVVPSSGQTLVLEEFGMIGEPHGKD